MSELEKDQEVVDNQEPETDDTENLTQEQINDITYNELMESAGGEIGGNEPGEPESQEPEEPIEEADRKDQDSIELLKRTQKKHQELIDNLKKQHPDVYNQYYNPPVDPVQPVGFEQQPTDDYILDDEEYLTPTKLVKILNDRERQQEAKKQQIIQQRAKAQLNSEITEANNVMTQCATDLGLTQDEYNAATAFAGQYVRAERPGDPAKFVDLAYKQMLEISRGKIQGKQLTKAQAEVEKKMKTAMMVKQPSTGKAPIQRELTAEEKMIKIMRDAGGGDAAKDIFG